MARQLNVYLLPSLATQEQLAGRTAVVIDVLRATTTITCALAAGAESVVPCLEVEEARRVAAEFGADAVLGGERGGERIEGFDFGNSPTEYTAEKVQGRTVVFTTTNGTRAMRHCQRANRILLGSFVNLTALVEMLADEPAMDLVCAGTDGEITSEDVLLAGAVAERFGDAILNDQARIARSAWRDTNSTGCESGDASAAQHAVYRAISNGLGARNLARLGFEDDIQFAADVDRFDVVPELDTRSWRIRLA